MRFHDLFATAVLLATAPLPVDKVLLPGIRVTLGETPLADAANILGRARVAHTGDAGDSRYQTCYQLSGTDRAKLYLEAGEMTGGERIEQIEVIAPGAAAAAGDTVIANDCSHLAAAGTAIRTDRGIHLGSLRADVDRLLRQRGRDSAGVTIYEAFDTRRVEKYRATAYAFIRVRYRNARLVAFAAAANITK